MSLTDFELKRIEENARRLIVCTSCYGVGQREFRDGSCQICKVCAGSGKSAAEPHVLKLIEDMTELRRQLAEVKP
jgi:hypothetical protein